MNAQEIRRAYLQFFTDRQHVAIPRAQLVPKNDPTTLFTGSGMQPLLPFLLGEIHPAGARLVNSQPSLRAQDIEDVGDNRHTTFFEMLGNWSMGDYSKEQQIRWFFEFLTDTVGLDPQKIYVTCFIGDTTHGIARDDVSAHIWQQVFAEKGITAEIVEVGSQSDGDARGINLGERIFFYDDSENWWSRGGGLENTPIGDPCGPDSEVFYDFGPEYHADGFGLAHPASDSGQFMEIGNQVFMQYRRTASGFEPLAIENVDFGGGLERIAAAQINSPDVFKISLLWPIIEKLEQLSNKSYDTHTKSMRVIADHLRAATFLSVDGITPSNKEQGYVMRRLLRRAIRFAFDLGIENNFLEQVVPIIIKLYQKDYPEITESRETIVGILEKEEKAFRQTIRKGIKEFNKIAQKQDEISGKDVFTLHDTYGFPAELTVEEAFHWSKPMSSVWRSDFEKAMHEQRTRSQTAAKGTFKGGLEGDTAIHKKYHTATHLMYQALRDVLGSHIKQRGSNITEDRLRFDFSHPEKVTREQLNEVERIVNEQIKNDLKISWAEYPTKTAIEEMGALGQFGDRYGETVKVYKMIADDSESPYSFEICGGPHVDHTLELREDDKVFKIIKEESSSAGIRRIKAVLA